MDEATVALQGAALGIVGFGSIGREVADRAAAFGLRVVAVDPQPIQAPPTLDHLWGVDQLDRLLALSDFVVIAAPHTPWTARLFDRNRLRRMKPSAYLINVGRGVIVVLDDLVEALDSGTIAGAALDVFETEPLPADHPLWGFENVIITPHVGGYAPTVAARHLGVVLENVRRFRGGLPLVNVVDKARWY